MDEHTLLIIKPDAVKQEAWLAIIQQCQHSGLKVKRTRLMANIPPQVARALYWQYRNASFYDALMNHISSGPIIALHLEGRGAIQELSRICGVTDSREAGAGTIRQLYGTDQIRNAVHVSDCEQCAVAELNLFFKNDN